jgi:plasmid maintenance system antidote protein VapI
MKDEEISINGLAQAIGVPPRFGRYLAISAHYWLNIQNRFDLDFPGQGSDRAGRPSERGGLIKGERENYHN